MPPRALSEGEDPPMAISTRSCHLPTGREGFPLPGMRTAGILPGFPLLVPLLDWPASVASPCGHLVTCRLTLHQAGKSACPALSRAHPAALLDGLRPVTERDGLSTASYAPIRRHGRSSRRLASKPTTLPPGLPSARAGGRAALDARPASHPPVSGRTSRVWMRPRRIAF